MRVGNTGFDDEGWNNTVREDADTRLGSDLYALCNANRHDAPEASPLYTWTLPSRWAVDSCERAAGTIKSALGVVPFGWIDYDHE